MRNLIFALICILAVSCSQVKKQNIGVSQCSEDDWRALLNSELRREAMFYDNTEVEVKSAHDDSKQQIADIHYFINKRVDLLIVAPNVAADVRPAVEEAFDKGIPVILIDRKTDGNKYTAFVGADNNKVGEMIAEYIISQREGEPTTIVEIRGLEGSSPAVGRHNGFMRVVSRKQNIKVVASAVANWNEDEAEIAMDSLLESIPHIDIVYAHNDRMANGARKALEKAGRQNETGIIGVDALMNDGGGVDAVIERKLMATCLYPTGGTEAIDIATKILEGKEHPKEITLPIAMIDKSNAKVLKMQYKVEEEQAKRLTMFGGKIDMQLKEVNRQRYILYSAMIILVLCVVIIVGVYRLYINKSHMAQLLENHKHELEEKNDKLIEMSHELEEATHAKLMFFTNVSHDFRTPLTLIADPIEQVLNSDMTEKQRSLLSIANKNVKVLLRLVNQLLDFSKVDNKQMTPNWALADIRQLTDRWVELFRPSMAKGHVSFEYSCEWDERHDSIVPVDVDKLEAIIYNLIGNAIKFTPSEGRITLNLKSYNDYYIIKVSDTGSGIPEDKLSLVFDRFFQAANHPKGSGVGLALVKKYVELLEGEVKVESMEGHGATFIVKLPIKADDGLYSKDIVEVNEDSMTQMLDADEENDFLPGEHDSNQPTALVVEDNEKLRNYVATSLATSYNVIVACDGKEGLEIATKVVPDIIVSDVLMPVMSGLELCKEVKSNQTTSHIPVILLTACSLDEQQIQGFDSGADGYISKPFNIQVLLSRMDNLIQNRRLLAEIYSGGELEEEIEVMPQIESQFITKMRECIEKRMGDSSLSVNDIADDMALSRVQLYRKVKALTNHSVSDVIRIARLDKAKKLLTTTEKSVSEIAYEVGFSAPSYFTKCYKEHFGISPSEHRS